MSACLTLNATNEPLRLTSMKRALRLVIDGKAEVVASHGGMIRIRGQEVPRPAVIRLTRYVYVPFRLRRNVTNTLLFARDGYRCQYCGRGEHELGTREWLNRDHVIPRAKGGTDTWDNVVTACTTCNSRKADRLLSECRMKLLRKPGVPEMVKLAWTVRQLTDLQRKYIREFYGAETVAWLERRERRAGRGPDRKSKSSRAA